MTLTRNVTSRLILSSSMLLPVLLSTLLLLPALTPESSTSQTVEYTATPLVTGEQMAETAGAI